MTCLAEASLAPAIALAPDTQTPVSATRTARTALEQLLELAFQVLDGDALALLDIPGTLSRVTAALNEVHDALSVAALHAPRSSFCVLTEHVAYRRRQDLRELDKLSREVRAAQESEAVGRNVVIAALALLANLTSDERCYTALHAH